MMTRLELRACKVMRLTRKPPRNPKAAIPQTALCQALGISQPTLSKIEHGETVPSLDTWFRFCRLFNGNPDPMKWVV